MTLKEVCLKFSTNSDKETIKLGQKLGSLLSEGDLVALVGVLGSGKTWFTKGLALGLDVDTDTVITSPSFALVNEYEGRLTFYHMDLYRLENLSDLFSAGLGEYLNNGGVVVVEWADRWPEIFPDYKIEVRFFIIDEHRRDLVFSGSNPRSIRIIDSLKKDMERF